MGCLKCGRELKGEGVFCPACIAGMDEYPVKPGTVVRLPHRPEPSPFRKTPKRRGPSPEEQVKVLRRQLRVLAVMLLLSFILIGVLAVPTYEHVFGERLRPGQNYSTVVHTTPSTATNPSGGN